MSSDAGLLGDVKSQIGQEMAGQVSYMYLCMYIQLGVKVQARWRVCMVTLMFRPGMHDDRIKGVSPNYLRIFPNYYTR